MWARVGAKRRWLFSYFSYVAQMSQEEGMGIVPRVLEATAHNIDYLQRSMDVLWDIARTEGVQDNSDESARRVLKRLGSYELNRWAGFNFAVLLHCIRLCRLPEAFAVSFTPLDVIDQILEREGEYTEFNGNTIRFGGFGLNYGVVGLMQDRIRCPPLPMWQRAAGRRFFSQPGLQGCSRARRRQSSQPGWQYGDSRAEKCSHGISAVQAPRF